MIDDCSVELTELWLLDQILGYTVNTLWRLKKVNLSDTGTYIYSDMKGKMHKFNLFPKTNYVYVQMNEIFVRTREFSHYGRTITPISYRPE